MTDDILKSGLISAGWAWYVAIFTMASLVFCLWILRANRTQKGEGGKDVKLHGTNQWDGLREWDNPLPKWWSNLFYITVFFSIGYLLLYPGLIVTPGALNWSTDSLHRAEVQDAKKQFDPIFDAYMKQDVKTVAADKGALQIGGRLYQTYCVQCHGTDMRGSKGFPNLVDNDWLYGGTPEAIKTSILDGRNGMMPAFGEQLKPDQVTDVAQYALSLSGRSSAPDAAKRGEETFKTTCAACHGPDGKGNPALGAPNLTDNVWLYGGSVAAVAESIGKGRQGKMPAHKDLLGEPRVHLLAAYVFAQSQSQAGSK
ncbi:MAG: cytochrome-c oxidase, cbb3-type subunit III [Burkholderiales bacterium]|nr:cytochrome-c oxidase, cbb3-type subunit III [Burkholderiales bacterium]